MKVLELLENESRAIDSCDLTEALAVKIAGTRFIDVEFPNPLNKRRFVLEPRNIVGLVPIDADLMIRITPKLRVANVFGMLEVVHDLTSFRVYTGIGRVEAIEDIYDRLARMFARGVLARIRRGLDSDYVSQEEVSSVVRGRIDVVQSAALGTRGSSRLHCAYEERTIDIESNRILFWTLDRIPRLGLKDADAICDIRIARRAMSGSVQLKEMKPSDCIGLRYNRLNSDYAMLHALARFFLERMGPGVASGTHDFIPFTVNMPHLFQEYVVACLKRAAPPGIAVRARYRTQLKGDFDLEYEMDAVIVDENTQQVLIVVDAKYKLDRKPSYYDINQVIAYATHSGARCALLIYPTRIESRRPTIVGPAEQMFVEAIGLPLGEDLHLATINFTDAIFKRARQMLPARQNA